MPDLPRYLKQLDRELLALGEEAMLLEVLDGFIAGLLVYPELIPLANGYAGFGTARGRRRTGL